MLCGTGIDRAKSYLCACATNRQSDTQGEGDNNQRREGCGLGIGGKVLRVRNFSSVADYSKIIHMLAYCDLS